MHPVPMPTIQIENNLLFKNIENQFLKIYLMNLTLLYRKEKELRPEEAPTLSFVVSIYGRHGADD